MIMSFQRNISMPNTGEQVIRKSENYIQKPKLFKRGESAKIELGMSRLLKKIVANSMLP